MNDCIAKSFKVNIFVMKICGLYPSQKHKILSKVHSFFFLILFTYVVSVLAIIKMKNEKLSSDLTNVTPTFVMAATCFAIKFLPFILNGPRIRKLMYYFTKSCYVSDHQDHYKKIIDDCVSCCHRNSLIYCLGAFAISAAHSIRALFTRGSGMPLDIWLPYDPSLNVLSYYITYIILLLAMLYNGVSAAAIDTLIAGLAYHATSELKILKYNLQYIQRNNKSINIYKKLEECVQHHNSILSFVKEFEQCFSLVVFCQFAGTVATAGLCLINMTQVTTESLSAIIMVLTAPVVLLQVFFYCYYGQLLFEENNTLANSIFMGTWYNYDIKSQKILIMMMECSKKPMIVTAGKVLDLKLNTFMKMLKTVYSLVTVLQNFQ